MIPAVRALDSWMTKARSKLQNGGVDAEDLDGLARIIHAKSVLTRQRILYLHAATPNLRSQVIGMALHEPVPGTVTEITTEGHQWPYQTVHDAVVDGWKIIHFPNQQSLFDDREIDILGYEFILQKLEVYDE